MHIIHRAYRLAIQRQQDIPFLHPSLACRAILIQRSHLDNRRCLQLELPPRRRALVREVLLHCQGRPLVLAHTVIPPRTLRGVHCGVAHLGDRPLGELLFAYRGLQRSHLEVARATQADWRHSIARDFNIEPPIWGRRSLYQVGRVSLSVCEFFLPSVLNLAES